MLCGKYIHGHILAHADKAGYGKSVFDRLAKEPDMGKRTLYRTVRFYKAYPEIVTPVSQSPWSHYLILLSVDDHVKRREHEQRVLKQKLSKRQLRELIKKDQAPPPGNTELEIIRGRPGVYRLRPEDRARLKAAGDQCPGAQH